MSKKSIRFFNDREVRAVWDEEHSKWWFSATDIVRAINDEDDYVKAGNYWRWLKKKFNADGIQLVSVTHDFKFQAPFYICLRRYMRSSYAGLLPTGRKNAHE
jgi:cell filamentation protein